MGLKISQDSADQQSADYTWKVTEGAKVKDMSKQKKKTTKNKKNKKLG